MTAPVETLLRSNPLYRRLTDEDRKRLAEVSLVRSYPKGSTIFSEGDPSDFLFMMLADRMGRAEASGLLIPLALSRQDLADLTGTTLETSIRIMSRWGKEGLVLTEKEGFVLTDRSALERLAAGS